MSGGSESSAAVREFKDWLQNAISCVTPVPLQISRGGLAPSSPGTSPHTVTLGKFPIQLRGPNRLHLSVDHHYWIARSVEPRGRWKVSTAAYYYAFDDAAGREILAYHWHPIERATGAPSKVPYPHMHIGAGAVDAHLLSAAGLSGSRNALLRMVSDAHLPTRRIALEDVVRLAIEQFEVRPNSVDWDARLRRSRAAFQAARTWL